jgi:hypothetical protein
MNETSRSLVMRLRWLAVGMVVLHHVRFILFANFSQLNETGALLKLFYFLTSYGHEGTVLYMLLSGLLLGGNAYRRWRPGHMALRHFGVRTLWFYALMIPALAIGGMLDLFGSQALGESGAYARFHEFSPSFGAGAYAANLLMVQRFLAPGLGSNAMLHILSYECWAYLSLASFFLPARRCIARLAAASIVLAGILLEPEFGGYLMLWLLGLAVATRTQWPQLSRVPASMVLVGALLVSRFGGAGLAQVPDHYVLLGRMLLDLQLGLGFALLLIAYRPRTEQQPGWGRAAWGLTRHFPGAHVAIFATHFPFMMFVAAAGNLGLGSPIAGSPSLWAFFTFACLVIAIYVYGFGICRVAFSVLHWLRRRPRPSPAPG